MRRICTKGTLLPTPSSIWSSRRLRCRPLWHSVARVKLNFATTLLSIIRIASPSHGMFWTILQTAVSLLPMSAAVTTTPWILHSCQTPCPFLPILPTKASCQSLRCLYTPNTLVLIHSALLPMRGTLPQASTLPFNLILRPVAPCPVSKGRISLRPKLIAPTIPSSNIGTTSITTPTLVSQAEMRGLEVMNTNIIRTRCTTRHLRPPRTRTLSTWQQHPKPWLSRYPNLRSLLYLFFVVTILGIFHLHVKRHMWYPISLFFSSPLNSSFADHCHGASALGYQALISFLSFPLRCYLFCFATTFHLTLVFRISLVPIRIRYQYFRPRLYLCDCFGIYLCITKRTSWTAEFNNLEYWRVYDIPRSLRPYHLCSTAIMRCYLVNSVNEGMVLTFS